MLICTGTRTNNKSVWAYSDAGGLLWSYDTGGSTQKVVVDSVGNVYVVGSAADNGDGNGTRNVWKLSLDGAYVIGVDIDSAPTAHSIDIDSNYVYVGHTYGADRLSHDLGSQTQIVATASSPSSGVIGAIKVDSSGNIYLGGGGLAQTLYKYNAALALQWTEDTNDSIYSIDFLSDGGIIVGTSDSEIRRYETDGSSASAGTWVYQHPLAVGAFVRAAVDSNDNIYGVTFNVQALSDKRVFVLNSSGVLQWEIDRTGDLENIVINTDGNIYVVGDDIGSYSGMSVNVSGQSLTNLIPDDSTGFNGVAWTPLTVLESRYRRRLVAIGGGEVWYESSAGTMAELSAANSDINTINPLSAIEAYQKIFIVNKTNLKVLDFINTKLSTADAGTGPCTPGMTLTGGTSSATMVVEYVNAVTDDAAMLVYGYRTSSSTFVSGETVTGTNSAGVAVSFVLDAAEVAPPHWYDWTVFGNDTATYGTMPTTATLVTLYRGRLVTNDTLRPHAWYMSKVGNPFKFLYDFTNDADLSAVAHSNGLVGVVGDIITSLIAYKDDLLIFGCSNSVWMLVGDPLGEGTLAQVTNSTGMWGAHAWCFDDKKNLYFLGNEGIYQMPISETSAPPENISKKRLPNLIADLDLDQSLHRVVFTFDPVENGIIISKTALSDGTNTNYFFSLVTQGWFKDSYPTSCGVLSSHYYPATDDTYKKLLFGCSDGYIREFDPSTKDDATTSSTSAISSYVTVVFPLGEDEDHEGLLSEMRAIVAGGESGGDFSDTDGVTWELHTGNDAETVLERIKDGETAFASGTWSSTGKQNKERPRMRGGWAGLKLYNSTATQTWAIEKVIAWVESKGRIR